MASSPPTPGLTVGPRDEDLAVVGQAHAVQNSGAPFVVTCEHASVMP